MPIELYSEDGSGRPTPLARVLDKSYALLHRHYRRVNRDELVQYGITPQAQRIAKPPPSPEKDDGADEDDSGYIHVVPRACATFGEFLNDPPEERMQYGTLSSSSSASMPSSSGGTGDRVLDDHSRLLHILCSAFLNDDGTGIVLKPYIADKWYDQCMTQPVMTSSAMKSTP